MIPEYNYWIGGKWKESPERLEVVNPYSNQIIGMTSWASAADTEEAISASIEAFKEMRQLPAFKRADILYRISECLRDRREEVARVITLESGKPINDARGEVNRAVNTFRVASEEAKRIGGK